MKALILSTAVLCATLMSLCACAPVMEATDYQIRTGTCGPLCTAIASATGQQVKPSVFDQAQFKTAMETDAAAHHMPAPLERKIDLSESPLAGTNRLSVIRELGPTANIVKDGDYVCDVYINQHPFQSGNDITCPAGRGASCPIATELNEAVAQHPVFHKIYSPAVPTGTDCSPASCGKHPVMMCYGADNRLKMLIEWNSDLLTTL